MTRRKIISTAGENADWKAARLRVHAKPSEKNKRDLKMLVASQLSKESAPRVIGR